MSPEKNTIFTKELDADEFEEKSIAHQKPSKSKKKSSKKKSSSKESKTKKKKSTKKTKKKSKKVKKKKTKSKKKSSKKKSSSKESKTKKKKSNKWKNAPTLNLKKDDEVALDFALKVYERFDKIIKSVVLFGSTAKKTSTPGSDIDIIIIIDDVSLKWDHELIGWYRGELDKILRANPYSKTLHINTIKLSTWWTDLMKGDPVVLNVLRNGVALIDKAGFFEPLKYLLIQGKIKSTPEAIYTSLQRAPKHITQSKIAEMSAIEGVYWSMVDSAHAALIAKGLPPASPEHIPYDLKEIFVDKNQLKMKYVEWYRDVLNLHKDISHGKIHDLKGVEIDMWQDRAEEFLKVMAQLVKEIIDKN